jgi:hypothetical protein
MTKMKTAALFFLCAWCTGGTAAPQDSLYQESLLPDSLYGEHLQPDTTLPGSLLPDSLFMDANRLYQEGRYEAALGTYRQVVDAGFESADLYYNMGNAAFRSNSIGYAILYYEKALKLDPFHEDALHNLEFVSRYRVDTFEEVPRLFIRTWAEKLARIFPERIWSMLSLLFFVLILASVVVYLYARRLSVKKAGFFSALFGLVFFLVALFSGIAQHRHITRPDAGIIISPSVVVKSTPSESGTELFILHEGTRVELKEGVTGWRNIRVIDGREGWIRSGDFESI